MLAYDPQFFREKKAWYRSKDELIRCINIADFSRFRQRLLKTTPSKERLIALSNEVNNRFDHFLHMCLCTDIIIRLVREKYSAIDNDGETVIREGVHWDLQVPIKTANEDGHSVTKRLYSLLTRLQQLSKIAVLLAKHRKTPNPETGESDFEVRNSELMDDQDEDIVSPFHRTLTSTSNLIYCISVIDAVFVDHDRGNSSGEEKTYSNNKENILTELDYLEHICSPSYLDNRCPLTAKKLMKECLRTNSSVTLSSRGEPANTVETTTRAHLIILTHILTVMKDMTHANNPQLCFENTQNILQTSGTASSIEVLLHAAFCLEVPLLFKAICYNSNICLSTYPPSEQYLSHQGGDNHGLEHSDDLIYDVGDIIPIPSPNREGEPFYKWGSVLELGSKVCGGNPQERKVHPSLVILLRNSKVSQPDDVLINSSYVKSIEYRMGRDILNRKNLRNQ